MSTIHSYSTEFKQYLENNKNVYTSLCILDSAYQECDKDHILKYIEDESCLVVSIGSSASVYTPNIVLCATSKLSNYNNMKDVGIITYADSEFSQQYAYWKSNRNLLRWKDQTLFHLNIPIIAATHLAILLEIEEVTALNINSKNGLIRPFDQKLTIQFLSNAMSSSHISFSSTSKSVIPIKKLLPTIDKTRTATVNRFPQQVKEDAIEINDSFFNLNENELFDSFNVDVDFDDIHTIAIVGNSGTLLDTEYGSEIDRHDCVIRFNAAQIKGYERHVGSKTTFRFINNAIASGRGLPYTETPNNWLSTIKGERLVVTSSVTSDIIKAVNLASTYNKLFILSENVKHFSSRIQRIVNSRSFSIGMLATLMMINVSNNITLYGFTWHQEDSLIRRHYWEEFKPNATDGGHDWKLEKMLMHQLADKQYIKLK